MLFAALAVLALSAPVAAEQMRLAQGSAPELLPPHEVVTIVRSAGFDPLGRPVRRGPNYVMQAVDEQDREVTLLINGRSGRVISATPFTTASRMPPRVGTSPEPYERMPPGYIPPPGPSGSYRPGPPVVDDDDDDDQASVYAPRPAVPVPGALPRSGYAGRPPAARAVPPDNGEAPQPSAPRVVTSAEPDQDRVESGALPPPPERFPQRAVAPAAKPKPPVKRAAAAPKQAPLPRPKPPAKVEVAPPLPQETEKAPQPPMVPETKPTDPVPN
jgi:hypothetical protein